MTGTAAIAVAAAAVTRIIGIDPGSRCTGIGIIEIDASGKSRHIFHQSLVIPATADFAPRLKHIFDGVLAAMDAHQPDEAAIERVFMARNADSALKLGQARGAAICALVCRGMAVSEYAATEVKRAVVGSGRADKTQVQHMIGILLGLAQNPQADAADALAVALAHAHTRTTTMRVGVGRTAWRRR